MQNLLKSGVKKEGKGLEINLYQISGKARPEINNIETYHWGLQIRGNKTFTWIQELRVDFSFFGRENILDSQYFEIIDYIPRREKEDRATLELSLPQFIKVTIPIRQDKITTNRSPTRIEWIFKDINLSDADTLACTLEGVVTARFFRESAMKKIGIAISVIPEFRRKEYYIKSKVCSSPPIINHDDVKNACSNIIPGDPTTIGLADLERPDSKKLFIYNYLINEGILQKGSGEDAVRNVSLRAQTVSILFDKLRTDLENTKYYLIIKDAGRDIGSNFAEELERILGHVPTLDEWFDYDSSAGMGRFEMNKDKDEIIVKNSFLSYGINGSNKPVCCFLEGYFESMLEKIFARRRVMVIETHCESKGDKYCRFKIS